MPNFMAITLYMAPTARLATIPRPVSWPGPATAACASPVSEPPSKQTYDRLCFLLVVVAPAVPRMRHRQLEAQAQLKEKWHIHFRASFTTLFF